MLIRLLGPVEVLEDGAGDGREDGAARPLRGLRRKAVLAVLALHRGEIVSADRITDIVWADGEGATGTGVTPNTLQSHMSHLRRVLGGAAVIRARPPGYVLDLGPGSVDVEVAEDLVKRGIRLADPAARAAQLQAALRLWHGRPLADVAGVPWLEEQAQRLDQLWLQTTHALIEARLALGEHAQLVPELEQLAREHPLDEQVQGQLILALYRTDRQADALSAVQRVRRALGEELGIDPSRTLRELESAILRQDDELRAAAPPVINLGGAELIGRAAEVELLHGALRKATAATGGTVFLVGEPGIGKTRLAAEAARLADELGLTVLRGRATGAEVTYRPLSEALLSVLRRQGPPADAGLRPYLPALSRLVPEWRGGTPTGGDESLVVLAEAVLRLLTALNPRRGCLLVLEDLHDADADTLAVLDYLADNAAGQRLLVLGTARGGPSPALELMRAARRRRVATVAELAGLDPAAVRRLGAACLGIGTPGAVPEPVAERLLATTDGVPLHVEELIAGLIADRVLVRTGPQWTLAGPVATGLPESLVATLAGRADRLGPDTGRLLHAAALLGRCFPAHAAGAAAGLAPAAVLDRLRAAIDAQLLVAQDDPQWFAFRHVLTAEALRARLLPAERTALARRVAQALEAAPPERGEWEHLAGRLWQEAGEPGRAAGHYATAGRRMTAHGALSAGIALLERSLSIVDDSGPAAAELGLALVDAYADAGRISDAYRLSARFEGLGPPGRRAAMHLRLARVAAAAGDWRRGLGQVAECRRLLGPAPDPATGARLDAVEAELLFGDPDAGSVHGVPAAGERHAAARALAERALRAAEATGQPEVACGAIATLGRCARLRDLDEAGALYARGLAVADAHRLAGWRVNLLFQLGVDRGVRDGEPDRLVAALAAAEHAGAVVTALDIELELAVVRMCRGEFAAAEAAVRRCEETAERLRLGHTRRIALGERIIAAAHQARRADVDALLARYREAGGPADDFATAVEGFGVAICDLLHEDHGPAWSALSAAAADEARRPASYVSFVHGPHLLLSVLRGLPRTAGTTGAAEPVPHGTTGSAQARWNRQFAALADAVIAGAGGPDGPDGSAAMARFFELSRPFPLARHLGLRLVAPAAIAGGWGEPVAWLRAAEAYFHDRAPLVARACRLQLRGAGAPVPQHRAGSADLPGAARRHGITVRENDVLELVGQRLGNREIGRRLFLSPRTVEKHVASLLAKTAAVDRAALAEFAAGVSAGRETG